MPSAKFAYKTSFLFYKLDCRLQKGTVSLQMGISITISSFSYYKCDLSVYNSSYEFYSGKKKLFRIDNNLSDGAILAGMLEAKKIPCDKAGMTIDKFTLKTRGVYKAVSAMSVGFFCWMVWVMIEQNETNIIFFRPMLALAVISLIIFIDLITDRFSVNGTRVTRRRGLIVKKFDISEIESTRLKKGLFGEKIEFYVKGKCIAKVSTNNQPYDLLDRRIRKEHILRKR